MRPPEIDLEANVDDFFRDVVVDAIRARGLEASADSTLYISTLLADYARRGGVGKRVLGRPLILILHDALSAPANERFERLRCLGDDVLYLAGFFAGHLERRGVEPNYVVNVGSRAYDAAGSLIRPLASELSGPDVFDELSSNFDRFVDVLGVVADELYAQSARDDRDVLDLYERWSRTRSSRLATALGEWGLIPQEGDDTVH